MTHSIFNNIFGVFDAISDGRRAERTYHRLSNVSDAELARQGLDRHDLIMAAFRPTKR